MQDKNLQRVKISQIIESQIPEYFLEGNDNFVDFLKQYYISQEYKGSPLDILENINFYSNADAYNQETLVESTTLSETLNYYDTDISVKSTRGWPSEYGLLKIDDEIITYTGITTNTFTGCIRGFCGVDLIESGGKPENFVFKDTVASDHVSGVTVLNLSNLYLKRFFENFKSQYTPGFEQVDQSNQIDLRNLTTYVRDYYKSKGTDRSFKILFDILFKEKATITKPAEQLFTPSDSRWIKNSFIIVEDLNDSARKISKNLTLKQDARFGFSGGQGVTYFSTLVPTNNPTKKYARIGFDITTLSGSFNNTAMTKVTSPVSVGSNSIIVDSTVGFPPSGKIYIKTSTGLNSIDYGSKTLTEFVNCVGLGSTTSIGEKIDYLTEIYEDNFLYGTIDGETKYFAITNTISDFNKLNVTNLSVNDKIDINSFGYINDTDNQFTSWIYNISNRYNVLSYEVQSSNQCEFVLDHKTNLFSNDEVVIGIKSDTSVSYIDSKVSSIDVNPFLTFDTSKLSGISTSNIFIRKKIIRGNNSVYSNLNQFTTNVQNTYIDDENFYVSSSSLPDYVIDVKDNSIIFDKTDINTGDYTITIPGHNYYSGQVVYYQPQIQSGITISNLQKGQYFVKKIDDDKIALCFNKINVFKDKRVELSYDSSTSSKHKLTLNSLFGKDLTSQNLLKKFPLKPKSKTKEVEILPANGSIGLFVNGVEILNSGSEYDVFYGPIDEIVVSKSLDTINVIDSPKLVVSDDTGTGVDAWINTSGSITDVIVEDPGFRILSIISAEVVGGNGNGSSLEPILKLENNPYVLSFDAQSTSGITTLSNLISFTNNHKLVSGDRVQYNSNSQTPPNIIGTLGITTSMSTIPSYYVGIVSERSIKLYLTYEDSLSGSNEIDITTLGTGTQLLTLSEPISKVSSVIVSNGGFAYSNRKIQVKSQKYPPDSLIDYETIRTGINTEDHYIFAKNHNFNNGDLVQYSIVGSGTSIGNLKNSTEYYILKIDNNKFRLSESSKSTTKTVGVGTQFFTVSTSSPTTEFLDQQKYIKLSSVGVGTHSFKYPDIKVRIDALTSIGNTTLFQKVKCLGSINDVFIYDGGSNYGTEDIFNYQKQPNIELSSGSGAKINPIIDSTGSIVDVVIKKGGSNYIGSPQVIVSGEGSGAILVPTLVNGVITDITIKSSGSGYVQKTTKIDVVPIGSENLKLASFKAKIKSWHVNAFELNKKLMTLSDHGTIVESLNTNYGNKYANYVLPSELRFKLGDNIQKQNDGYTEDVNPTHSPIVGWAYDGNPIYGPYGYSSPTNTSTIKRLESGYSQILKSNRPSIAKYPLGFFESDYVFVNNGDLDEHNGRFGVTPEFPNGTYAYFCPISTINGSGAFLNTREPVYPYIIGSSFKNDVDEFNFENTWNTNLLDSNTTSLTKNLSPYFSKTYEFLDFNTSPLEKIFELVNIGSKNGKVDNISVINSGNNYKVDEKLIFDETNTQGNGIQASVGSVVGKGVSSIVGVNTYFNNVKLTFSDNYVIGITTSEHNLITGDVIRINSVRSENEELGNDITDFPRFKQLVGFHKIFVPREGSIVSEGISSYSGASVGLTTFIKLYEGNLTEKYSPGEIVGIGTANEKLLILNIDTTYNRLRVVRGYNPLNPNSPSTSGIAYTTGEFISKLPTKFQFQRPNSINDFENVSEKKTFFFDPLKSVGIGTSGVYVSQTVGLVTTTKFVPEKTIYIPNHNLQTGDRLIYDSASGSQISVSKNSNLSSPVSLGQTVFAIRKGNDFIGLTTTTVGIGSTQAGLYFVSVGSGEFHSLTADFGEPVISEVQKTYVLVTTKEDHGLTDNDQINLSVHPKENLTKKLKYNSTLNKLLVGFSTITSAGIVTGPSASSITITNHGLQNGSKILYESSDPALPLVNGKEYFAIKVDDNIIRLSNYSYDSRFDYNFIELTSVGSGIHTISYINPKIDVIEGNTLKFDTSDVSLQNFEVDFYLDDEFNNQFVGTGTYFKSSSFEIKKVGVSGNSGSYVELDTNLNIPNILYYTLSLKDKNSIQNAEKNKFVIDTDVPSYCKIVQIKSDYNSTGNCFDSSLNTKQFKVLIQSENPFETSSYSENNTNILKYTTTSLSAQGPINSVKLISSGIGYKSLPTVISVNTKSGTSGEFKVNSSSIGNLNQYLINNPTYEIPSDFTVKPILSFPISIKLKDNRLLSSIGITTGGKGYLTPPRVIAVDKNGNEISGLEFQSSLTSQSVSSVTITENKNDLPTDIFIISTKNANGFIVDDATYNAGTKTATLTLDQNLSIAEFSKITTGQKIYVEGIESISGVTTTTSYNSDTNGYNLFTITNSDSANKTIEYLITHGNPGNINSSISNGFVTLEKDLAKFKPIFEIGNFKNGELVDVTKSNGSTHVLQVTLDNGWNGNILKLRYIEPFSTFNIEVGDIIVGRTSLQKSTVSEVNKVQTEAVVNFSYVNSIGWERDFGKLSVSGQKISDNDYYQKMSYDVKSPISPQTWKPIMDSLNHTSGLKSFGSLIIVSEPKV